MFNMFLKRCVPVTYVIVLLNAFNIKIIQTVSTVEDTLHQVHVVFRHGHRTPDKITLYPNDPHINDTWHPYGLGALTNLGKKQKYELGKILRKRYDTFLGDLYLPGIQEAMSTSETRAKLSLQLVLAGLWPPNKQQTFTDDLPWQPIDYKYKSFKKDELLGFPLLRKSPYQHEYNKIESSDEVQNYMKRNKDKIDHININSGLRINHTLQLLALYFGLYAEEQTNRTLPVWTKSIYPEFLEETVKYSYILQTATKNMMKFAGGPLLKKVLLDAKNKINGITPSGDKKIFLYSGHEFNIAHILRALKSYKPHIPQYSSYIIFELHKIGPTYGFKIYYQDTTQKEPKLLDVPECGQFCSADKFEDVMRDVMPKSGHRLKTNHKYESDDIKLSFN